MKKALKDLGLALINATVLLLIILLVVGTLFLSRVNALRDGITTSIASTLAPQAERLDQISAQLDRLNTRLETTDNGDSAALTAEITALRKQLPDFSQLNEISSTEIAKQVVDVVAARLSSS